MFTNFSGELEELFGISAFFFFPGGGGDCQLGVPLGKIGDHPDMTCLVCIH